MPTTANPVQPRFKSALLAVTVVATLFASGCATPTGAAFTAPAPVPEGQAQVYLYRSSNLNAAAQSFSVQLDKKDVGELLNASYLHLQMATGEHLLSVKPGAFGKTYDIPLKLADKQTQYFEFELPHFLLSNAFHLGSNITPRPPERAATDMQVLKGVK
jgi:Protein of unknown function (DUF2846)